MLSAAVFLSPVQAQVMGFPMLHCSLLALFAAFSCMQVRGRMEFSCWVEHKPRAWLAGAADACTGKVSILSSPVFSAAEDLGAHPSGSPLPRAAARKGWPAANITFNSCNRPGSCSKHCSRTYSCFNSYHRPYSCSNYCSRLYS